MKLSFVKFFLFEPTRGASPHGTFFSIYACLEHVVLIYLNREAIHIFNYIYTMVPSIWGLLSPMFGPMCDYQTSLSSLCKKCGC